MEACSEPIKRGFSYGKISDDKVLVLFFTHQACLHEFTIKYSEIVGSMRKIYKREKLQGSIFFKKIEGKLAPKMREYRPKSEKSSLNPFKEKSTGNFRIGCEDERLRSLFGEIQTTIKMRIEDEQI